MISIPIQFQVIFFDHLFNLLFVTQQYRIGNFFLNNGLNGFQHFKAGGFAKYQSFGILLCFQSLPHGSD